ncbi:hypothetical protein HUU42_05320 [bacterium]|nr:hypothetical protein [bacterium]
MEIKERKLKLILKDAVKEAMEEEKQLLYDTIFDVLEDVGMARAIEAGKNSKRVSKEKILKLLERK